MGCWKSRHVMSKGRPAFTHEDVIKMPSGDGSGEDKMTFSIGHGSARDRRLERTEMRLVFLISYPLCLVAAMTGRITHAFNRRAAGPAQSIFAEARSSAHAAIGYAFNV